MKSANMPWFENPQILMLIVPNEIEHLLNAFEENSQFKLLLPETLMIKSGKHI